MLIQSKYDKSFRSDNLTNKKYEQLVNFAMQLRDYRNDLSELVSSDLLFFLQFKKLEFLTYIRKNFEEKLHSNFDVHQIVDVFTCYQNKFDAIKRKLTFQSVRYICCETYKRNTKGNKKGDYKKTKNERKSTPLSKVLTYLARYGNENTVSFIEKQLNENLSSLEEGQVEFYKEILAKIEKFGFDRLYGLALSKRKRIIEKYAENPIEFKSLTFRGRCRKKLIIEYNKNFKSVIKVFIVIGIPGYKEFYIPVKYSKEWFGDIKDYAKKTNDYEYKITFDEKKKQVNIHLCKDGERYLPDVNEQSEVVGIDVNIKHNLFCLSDGTTYDYDRKLVNDYCKLATYLDSVKEKEGKDYQPGKRYQFKIDKLREKIRKSEQQLISDICKDLQAKGITHVVMEELDGSFGKSYVKDKTNEDINFNRILKFLRISSLKDEFEHIARNYGIGFSTVQSYYTSKMCPICGCIEDENRPTQEEFCCIECGHSENADFNAAINIRNRVVEAVLREHLLKQSDNGAYKPKNLKKEKVKEVLLSFRRNLKKTERSSIDSESSEIYHE